MTVTELLDSDPIGSLPLREPIAVGPGTIVRAAVARMRTRDLGCVVLLGPGGNPIGIFTERGLLKLLNDGQSLDNCPVSDYADFNCVVVKRSDPIADVWRKMHEQGVRFVCVTDDRGRLVGLTGQRGLSEYLSDCYASEVAVQRIGGTPWMESREGA